MSLVLSENWPKAGSLVKWYMSLVSIKLCLTKFTLKINLHHADRKVVLSSCKVIVHPQPDPVVYCHIWAIYVCAAVKGMVIKPFTLG